MNGLLRYLDPGDRKLSGVYAMLRGMGWMDQPRLVLDTETTGVEPTEAHLVTACLMYRAPDGVEGATWNWMADPGVEIPTGASDVHGVTTERARAEGKPEGDVLASITELLAQMWNPETPLVIYNAPYDLTLLDRRCRALGLGPLKIRGPVLDALVLDRITNRYRKGGRKLITMCGHFGVELSEADAHSADADCRAAHELTWAMGKALPEIAELTLRQLYVVQRRGHREWAVNFQRFLRNAPRRPEETDEQEAARKVVVIDTEWPMQSYTEEREKVA